MPPLILAIVVLGLSVRLLFLHLSGELEPWADEAAYVQQAVLWSRFGFYMAGPLFLWPPAYPAFLTVLIHTLGESGLAAAKLSQVLLSAVIGASVMLLAWRAFDRRAAIFAGVLWSLYLPLVGYTHYLWPETLFLVFFLPAIYQLMRVLEESDSTSSECFRLVAAGWLLGLCILTKEVSVLLPPLFGLALLVYPQRMSLSRRGVRSAILILTTATLVLPWGLRNVETYGRWVGSGATLGRNLYWGVNGRYINFDYTTRHSALLNGSDNRVYRWMIQPPAGSKWAYRKAPNLVDQSRLNVRLGRQYIAANPGFYLRSRLKHLADWVTPLSFFDRHYRLGIYRGFLARSSVRRSLVLISVLATMIVMAGAIPGLARLSGGWAHRAAFLIPIGCLMISIAVTGMSRYRLPAEPLFLVLTAGALAAERRSAPIRWPVKMAVATGWGLLAFLWMINSKEIWRELSRVI